MANFNFVDSAAKGYLFLSREFRTVARLSILPLLIKLVTYVGITAFDLTDNYFRQGWVLVPSYFAEGWLVCSLIRYALYGEAGPLRRSNLILAGALTYVLIKLVFSFIVGGTMDMAEISVEAVQHSSQEPSTQIVVVGMALLAASIWAFRLMWLYIPLVMGVPIKGFLRRISGFLSSVHMIGIWVMAMMPLALVFMFFSEIMFYLIPGSNDAPSILYQFVFITAQSATELMIAVVTTIAMAHGIQSAMGDE